MSEFRWDFTANTSSAKVGAQNINILNQVINNYQRAANDAAKATNGWFAHWTRNAGIFNTWNKAIRFLVDDIQMLSKALLGWIGKAANAGQAFSGSAAALKTMFGEGEAGYGKLIQDAIHLGDVTQFSTSEVLAAATALKKAGQSGEDLAKNMKPVLDVTMAEGVAMDKVADILANTQNQFANLSGADAISTLAAAGRASTTDLLGMAAAMVNTASLANKLGQDITQTSTVLAMFAQNGLKYGRAGSEYNRVLERLSSPTKKAKESFQQLGLSVDDVQASLNDPLKLLQMFNVALSNVPTAAKKIDLLKPIFGASADAMLPLIDNVNNATKGYQAMYDEIVKQRASLGQASETMTDTSGGGKKMFESSVEGFWMRLGIIEETPVKELYNRLANVVNVVNSHLDRLSSQFVEGGKTIEDWAKIIKEKGFRGVFEGLVQELSPELEKVKIYFDLVWVAVKEGLKSVFRFLGSPEVKAAIQPLLAQIKDGMREIEDAVAGVIFSPANIGKAKDFGIAVGKEIIAGLTSTGIGRVLVGLFVAKNVGAMVVGTIKKALTVQKFAASLSPAIGKTVGAGLTTLGVGATTAATAGAGAYIAGKFLEAEIEKSARGYENKQELRGAESYKNEIKRLSELKKTTTDPEKLARINAQLDLWSSELDKIVGESEFFRKAQEKAGDRLYDFEKDAFIDKSEVDKTQRRDLENLNKWLDPVIQSKTREIQTENEKRAYVDQRRQEQAQRHAKQGAWIDAIQQYAQQRGMPLAEAKKEIKVYSKMQRALANQTGFYANEAAPDEASLKLQQGELQAQMELTNRTQEYNEKLEQSKNILSEARLKILEMGKEFAKWMLEPVNQFKAAFAEIQLKWGDLVQGLKSKSVDIGEKFGLVSKEDAQGKRGKILEESIALTQEQLNLAQTPEMKAKMQERLADQFAQQAELTGNKDFARKAQDALEQAQTSALEQQRIDVRKNALEQKFTQDSIPLLEGMLQNTTTAGGKASILERLQKNYMSLGRVDEAAGVTRELLQAQMQAAEEQAANSNKMVEYLKTLVDLAKMQLNGGGEEPPVNDLNLAPAM